MKQMQKHRCRVVLICLMAMLMTLFAGFVSLAEENTPTRVINVVYDDSGSMVETGGQKANVAKVHEMLTKAGNTPFDAVWKAYSDLTEAQADEKWFVVLTDGEFQGVEDIDGFFRQKSPDGRTGTGKEDRGRAGALRLQRTRCLYDSE